MSLTQSAAALLESGIVCAAGVFNEGVMLSSRQNTPISGLKSPYKSTLANDLGP